MWLVHVHLLVSSRVLQALALSSPRVALAAEKDAGTGRERGFITFLNT